MASSSARAIAAVTKSLAVPTAASRPAPLASSAAIAEESVQPVPRVFLRSDGELVGASDRGGDEVLGGPHGRFEAGALGKLRGDRRGKRATGAVGIPQI